MCTVKVKKVEILRVYKFFKRIKYIIQRGFVILNFLLKKFHACLTVGTFKNVDFLLSHSYVFNYPIHIIFVITIPRTTMYNFISEGSL